MKTFIKSAICILLSFLTVGSAVLAYLNISSNVEVIKSNIDLKSTFDANKFKVLTNSAFSTELGLLDVARSRNNKDLLDSFKLDYDNKLSEAKVQLASAIKDLSFAIDRATNLGVEVSGQSKLVEVASLVATDGRDLDRAEGLLSESKAQTAYLVQISDSQEKNDLKNGLKNIALELQKIKTDASKLGILKTESPEIDALIGEITLKSESEGATIDQLKAMIESYSAKLSVFKSTFEKQNKDLQDKIKAEKEKALEELRKKNMTAPPPPTDTGKSILVSLGSQRAYLYQDGNLVRSFSVTTGRNGFGTPPGSYRVINKLTDIYLNSKRAFPDRTDLSYNLHVDYWLGIGGGYGFHDAYWRKSFGGKDYVYNGSHGCINTPYDQVKFMYSWADVGTAVKIV